MLLSQTVDEDAPGYSVTPTFALQGQLVVVRGPQQAATARLRNISIPLYADREQLAKLGLLPVPVLTKPGRSTIEWLDAHGTVLHAQAFEIRDAHYPSQNVVLTPALSNLHSSSEERDEVGAFMKERDPERFWPIPLKIDAPLPGCITSPFGVRRLHNGKPTGEFHTGLDQRGAQGSPIHAIAAGEVKLAQQMQLRGGTVAIDHGQGLKSIYLHMSKTAAVEGTRVAAGDVIGFVGSTGRSTGPHLHWTMYANGEAVNPLQWVKLSPCASEAKPPSSAAKRR